MEGPVRRRIAREFKRCPGAFYAYAPDAKCHYCGTLQGSDMHAGLLHNPCCKCSKCPEPPEAA
jgi:hypothetical protein